MGNIIQDSILKRIGKLLLISTVLAISSITAVGQDSKVATLNKLGSLYNGVQITQDISNSTILNKVISVDFRNLPLLEAINMIADKSNLKVVYNSRALRIIEHKISLKSNQITVETALWKTLEGTGLRFAVADNKQLILLKRDSNKQEIIDPIQETVSGRVTDADSGEPLPGVNIVVKGTTTGTSTNSEGLYELTVESLQDTLVFSFIGYQTQQVLIEGRTTIDIALQAQSLEGEELVVVGYGVQQKSDLTGTVSSVSSDELTVMPTTSSAEALQGKVAGVSVTRDSGLPGSSTSIQIRGVGTTNDTSPLYVIDGLPVDNIDYLNPEDIQSMEILKDASAAAIYGSRGANGVILITTKEGRAGDLKFNFRAYYGTERLENTPSMLSSSQYALLSNEAYSNAGEDPIYPNPNSMPYDTDWYDRVSHTGSVQNYNLSLSGGQESLTSFLSANYAKSEGIIKTTDFEKISLNQKSQLDVTDFFNIEATFRGVFSKNHSIDPTTIFLSSLIAPPDIPVINPETDYYTGISKLRLANPAGRLDRNNSESQRNDLYGTVNANLSITNSLHFQSRFGVSHRNINNSNFVPSYFETADISSTLNQVSRFNSKMTDWTWDNILTYTNTFNDVHDLTVMGTVSSREYNYENVNASKQNVPIEQRNYWYLGAATDNPQTSGDASSLSMLSYLGRLNYGYDNRYLITLSLRADGSSRFIGSNRWGYFPSGALAWRISEEDFFDKINFNVIESAKLRVSYGEVGNQNIASYYPYLIPIEQQQYYTVGANQERVNGAAPTSLGNPDVKWETAKQTNFGLDLSFLDGKVDATVDYYIRKTSDILLRQEVPAISGSGSIIRNVGGMENKGFEFSLSYQEAEKEFNYDIGLNFSTVKNKVTNLGSSGALISSFDYSNILIDFQGALGSMVRSEVGRPYAQFYGWETDGIFQNQQEIEQYTHEGNLIQPDAQPGDFKFKDNNGNGTIDDGDKTFIGSPLPDFTFGLTFNAYYKNFDLSLLLQGQVGNDIYNAAKYYFMRFDARNNVRTDYLDEYWSQDNHSNSQPVVTADVARNDRNFRNSDYYVENGSYLRLKTIQLGYNFTPNLGGVNPDFRVYLSAKNLLTLTGYSGFEPELSGNSIDQGIYPQAQEFMIGTIINF